jgi:hypothetical protein
MTGLAELENTNHFPLMQKERERLQQVHRKFMGNGTNHSDSIILIVIFSHINSVTLRGQMDLHCSAF